jgi:hypothetical protein
MATATLSQRIQLEGGDKIRLELDRIGKAAGDALTKLKGGSTGAVPAQQDLNKALTTTREKLEEVKASSESTGEAFLSFRTKMLLFTAAITGAVAGWVALGKAAADAAIEQTNAAAKIGTSVKALRELRGIGEVFGVSSDAVESQFKGVTEVLTKAGDLSKKVVGGFTEMRKGWFKLGTEITATTVTVGQFYEVERAGRRRWELATEANRAEIALRLVQKQVDATSSSLSESEKFLNNFVGGLAKFKDNPLGLFEKIAQELEKIPDPAKRAFIAQKAGLESVLPLVNAGVEEFKKYRQALKDLNVFEPLSDAQRIAAEDFSRILTTIQLGLARKSEDTKTAFYAALVKPLDEVLIEMRLRAKPLSDTLFELARSAGSLAGDIIRAFFPRVEAGTGKLVFGLNEDTISDTNKWVLTLRDTVVQFGRDVYNSVSSIVIPVWKGFLTVVTGVTEAVNGFLGTKFGSFELLAGGILLKLTGLFKLLGVAVGGIIGVFTGFGKAALIAGAALVAFGADGFDTIPKALTSAASKTKKEGDGFLAYVKGLFADLGNAFRFEVIGGKVEFIDTAKVSEANKWVLELRDTIVSFKDDVVRVSQSIIEIWTKVTDGFNNLFNTKFTPGQLALLLALAQMTGALTILVSLTVGLNALIGIIVTLSKALFGLAAALLAGSLPALALAAAFITFAVILGKQGLLDAIANATKGLLDFSTGPVKDLGKKLGEPWKDFKVEAAGAVNYASNLVRGFAEKRYAIPLDVSEAMQETLNVSAALDKYRTKLDAIKSIKFPKPTGSDTGGLSDRNDIEDDINDVIEATEDAAKGFAPIGKAADSAAEAVSKAFGSIATDIKVDEEGFLAPFRRIVEVVTDLFSVQLPSALQSAAATISSVMSSIADSVASTLARIEEALSRARAAASEASSLGGGGGSGEGFATGGYVRGSGSGTSDSIPAWLSNGEFVIRAAAVRQYGLSFLRAVNGMRLNPGRMKLGMPAFALGGLVDTSSRLSPLPAVGGGSGMSGAPVNLFIGGESFGTVYAPENTAAALQRYAASAQTRSLGRKPGWYK